MLYQFECAITAIPSYFEGLEFELIHREEKKLIEVRKKLDVFCTFSMLTLVPPLR